MAAAKCPICNKSRNQFEEPAKWIPFCSKRCKDIDMGKWLKGHYQVQRELEIDDLLEAGPDVGMEESED